MVGQGGRQTSLVRLFDQIRDRLAATDRRASRDEEFLPDVTQLILLKLREDLAGPAGGPGLRPGRSARETGRRVRALLEPGCELRIEDDSVHYVVEALQDVELLSCDADAVAEAFQVIRGRSFKGEEGQYFTPPSVVRVAVAAVDPRPGDRIVDPSCGSGSFLAAAYARVAAAAGRERASAWAREHLIGIDKDAVSARLARAYLSMLSGGGGRVLRADAIRPGSWPPAIGAVVSDGSFDVVLSNPPFGTKLKVPAKIGRSEGYELSRVWKQAGGEWNATNELEERDLGLIFLERGVRLLRDGGRMAIVLPDTYLFSRRYRWLVAWLARYRLTHSINVPIEAFEPHCRAKTSVLVLEKSRARHGHRVIGSVCETFGEDKHGRPRFRFREGRRTDERDDEMAATAELLRSPRRRASKLHFRFDQAAATARGVLVASYWWREPRQEALVVFAAEKDCELVAVRDLIDAGELEVSAGHGSPGSSEKGRGPVPYVKVVDIKNWRVNENPKYSLPEDVAEGLRRGRELRPYDLVTPTRASRNIGLFGVIMPWQTGVVLTREIAVWRVPEQARRIDPFLLLVLLSLRVVHDQFRQLVLMQMNREDLGDRYLDLLLPIPAGDDRRNAWSRPVRRYFEATVGAQAEFRAIGEHLDPGLFADRP